jgi:cell division protein FtsB
MRAGRRQYKSRRRSSRPGNGRALLLAVVLFVFALTLAPPIKHYFTQKAQINSLRSQLASDRAALDSARKELELWKDPNYVKSQARERLHFVLPGERQYIVTGVEGENTNTEQIKVADQLPEGQPWYSRLIASITESGVK